MCTAFVVHPAAQKSPSVIRSPLLLQAGAATSRSTTTTTTLASTSSPMEGEEREFARVRRRRGRREAEDDDREYTTTEADGNNTYEQRRQRRQEDAVYDNNDDWIDYDRLDDLLDDDDDHDGYIYDEEEYDLLSNVLIPNPLLDSMDPDGAAERFPELASDPRFWFDMVLFVAFLNFLSFAGPQDPFPDIPWY
eukprot:scaffold54_cov158-Amphora_coffeaeformis.AAC.8